MNHNIVFFFASGLFFKPTDFKTFINKRIHGLLIPFLFFYIMSIPYYILVDLWDNHFTCLTFDWTCVFDLFKVGCRTDYLSLDAPLWFLLALFWIQLISNVVLKLNHWVVALSVVCVFMLKSQIVSWVTPFMINNALYGYGYFIAGYMLGKPLMQYLSRGMRQKWIALFVSICLMCITYFSNLSIEAIVNLKECVNSLAFAVGFMTFWSFFDGNKNLNFLRYFGKNTLIVLGAHFWLLLPCQRFIYKIVKIHDPLVGLLVTIIIALLLVPMINQMNKRIPYLVGK